MMSMVKDIGTEVGDVLFIKEDLVTGEFYGQATINPDMRMGKTVTIAHEGTKGRFRVEEDTFYYTREMVDVERTREYEGSIKYYYMKQAKVYKELTTGHRFKLIYTGELKMDCGFGFILYEIPYESLRELRFVEVEFPQIGDTYFYVDSLNTLDDGCVIADYVYENDETDLAIIETVGVFKTYREAVEAGRAFREKALKK